MTTRYLGQVAGFRVTLRDGTGKVLRVLSNRSAWQFLDPVHAEVVYTSRTQILRIGEGEPKALIDRGAVGFAGLGGLHLASLPDRRVAIVGSRSLAVLESDGRVFATAAVRGATDTLRMRPDGRAAAYLSVVLSQCTSRRLVSIMLLAKGVRQGKELDSYRVELTPPAWHTELQWNGDWLLASSSDGHTVAIDSRAGRVADLTPLARALAHPSRQQLGGRTAEWR